MHQEIRTASNIQHKTTGMFQNPHFSTSLNVFFHGASPWILRQGTFGSCQPTNQRRLATLLGALPKGLKENLSRSPQMMNSHLPPPSGWSDFPTKKLGVGKKSCHKIATVGNLKPTSKIRNVSKFCISAMMFIFECRVVHYRLVHQSH